MKILVCCGESISAAALLAVTALVKDAGAEVELVAEVVPALMRACPEMPKLPPIEELIEEERASARRGCPKVGKKRAAKLTRVAVKKAAVKGAVAAPRVAAGKTGPRWNGITRVPASGGYEEKEAPVKFAPPADDDMGCRAQVWRALRKGPALSSELAALVSPLSSASVSLALSELRSAGVIRSEQDGRDRIHRLVE